MKKVILELLSSKKAVATMVGVLLTIVAKTGLVLPEDSVTEIVQVIMAYVIGQGIADHGKEKVIAEMRGGQ